LVPTYANTYYPGLNVAFVFSVLLTVGLTVAAFVYGKRRPVGKPLRWGEAMFAAAYIFLILFLAYGVVPHQWLTHADNELAWRRDKILYGPFNIFEPEALGGHFPFTITYEAVRDVIATVIYIVFLGANIWFAVWWQNRGKKAAEARPELTTSSYGRPLVRRG
jgi:hypothetical protein